MKMLGLLIFDMDGTLVDSMDLHAEVFSQILNESFDIPIELSKTEYLRTAGKPLDEQFKHVILLVNGFSPFEVDELLERFWNIIENTKPVLFPEVFNALTTMWEAGYKLAVTSGCSPSAVESKLKLADVSHFFTIKLGTNKDIPNMIKGSGHFDIIRNTLGLSLPKFRSHTAFIGDTNYDMNLGLSAGILTIGRVTHNNTSELRNSGALFVINNLSDLVNILKADRKSFMSVHELTTLLRNRRV